MKKVLDLFSGAFVINMDKNRDRMDSIIPHLAQVGIEFERLPGFQFEGGTRLAAMQGCNASHKEAAKIARARNYESVLIMEDDVVFRPDFLKLWSVVLPQLRNLDYDIFFGYDWQHSSPSPADLKVRPIAYTVCTHFWAIHSRFYDAFIAAFAQNEQAEKTLPSDRVFTSENARIYAPTYNLVGQEAGVSEITGIKKELRWSA